MLEVFAGRPQSAVGVADIQRAVEASGVPVTTDNLHQQLRRLVAAGMLERAGRGVYQLAARSSEAPASE